ncbi:hypothetical protein QCD79_34550, partial [Pseudomonas quasicaspiana]|nr:hypothetical protein [Pseudomonas quasicaspiana]
AKQSEQASFSGRATGYARRPGQRHCRSHPFLAQGRETDATGNVFVQVAEHNQWLDQKNWLARFVLHQSQVV